MQPDVILPNLSPDETQPTQTTGYLWAALQKGISLGLGYLTAVYQFIEALAHALPAL